MEQEKRTKFWLGATATLFLLIPSAAHAACSNPYGEAGDMVYNGSYDMMQFCNDTNWIAMGGGGGGGFTDKITDADDDTMVQVEEGSDDDNIRFDTAGTERMVLDENGVLRLNGVPGGPGVGGGGGTPSGIAGSVQFSNGTAFASDAANFFWDDTLNRLGIGTASFGSGETLAVQLASGKGVRIGTVTNDGSTALFVNTVNTTQSGIVVRGIAAQSGDLQQWQNSTGTSLAKIDSTGAVTATSFTGIGTGLTALNATNLGSGTVPVARLGASGTPSATTYLRGDNTWQTPSGGGGTNYQEFTTSGTWTKPASGNIAHVRCWGGGGGGGRGGGGSGGGGGGAYNERQILFAALPSTVAVTIGSGGAGRTGSNGSGSTGGTTTFTGFVVAYGGGGGGSEGGGGGGQLSAGGAITSGSPLSTHLINGALTTVLSFGRGGYVLCLGGDPCSDQGLPPTLGIHHGGGGGTPGAYGSPGRDGAVSYYGGGGGGGGPGGTGGAAFLSGGNGGNGSTGSGVAGSSGTVPGGGGGGGQNANGGNGGAGLCRVMVL